MSKRPRELLGELDCSMFESPAKRSCPSSFRLSQAVPKGYLKGYTHTPEGEMGTVSFFGKIFPALVALLTGELCFHQYKATLVMKVEMTKTTPDGKSKNMSPYFASKPLMITSQQDIEPVIRQAHQRIDSQIDRWTTEGSGWAVIRVMCLYVNIAKYQPLTGSSYVELPPTLKHKKVMLR